MKINFLSDQSVSTTEKLQNIKEKLNYVNVN